MKTLKTFPLLLLLIILSYKSYGQQYYPLLTDSTIWYVQANDGLQSTWGKTYKHYTTDYRVFNGKSYRRYNNNMNPNDITYLREDTALQKVWFFDPSKSGEVLIYDFGLAKGDSIPITFDFLPFAPGGTYKYSYYYHVDSVFNMKTLDGYRKAIWLTAKGSFLYDPYMKDTGLLWVEGVGSTAGPAYQHYFKGLDATAQSYMLTCSFSDTAHVYALYKSDSCIVDFGNVGIKPVVDNSNANSFRLIHGANAYCFLEMNLEKGSRISVSCYDIEGRLQFKIANAMYQAGISDILLTDIELLPHGVYFLQILSATAKSSYNQSLKFFK